MHRTLRILLLWGGLVMSYSCPSLAVEVQEQLQNPALEARARALSALVKCPTCQGQCIDDSNAQMARTLRLFIRNELSLGASDDDVLNALVMRFGQQVLFTPQENPHNFLLWWGPLLFLVLGGGFFVYRHYKTEKKH